MAMLQDLIKKHNITEKHYDYHKLVSFCYQKLFSIYSDVKAFVYIVFLRMYEQINVMFLPFLSDLNATELRIYNSAVKVFDKDGFSLACNFLIDETKKQEHALKPRPSSNVMDRGGLEESHIRE